MRILLLVLWLLAGFICAIFMTAMEVRGEKYDNTYFDCNFYIGFIFLVVFGFVSIIFTGFCYSMEYEIFNKFIYKLANIGIKKKIKHRSDGE